MKFFFFLAVLFFISFTKAFAFDVTLLRNNKESFSRLITKKDRAAVSSWERNHRLGAELRAEAGAMFRDVMKGLAESESQCDLGLPASLIQKGMEAGIIQDASELRKLLVLLRDANEMDDILMSVILTAEETRKDIAAATRWVKPKTPRGLRPAPAGLDLKKYFGYVTSWPDEVNHCSIGRYFRMSEMLTYKNRQERDTIMWRLAHIGVRDGHIDVATFHRLEALRLNQVMNWDHYAYGYLDMVKNAKDKMVTVREETATNTFSENYVSRKEKLTQRGKLYKVFSPTQVMIMSTVIEKLSRRMDARRVELSFQYGEDAEGEREIYVLSPMEQYRVSINMMKKEMGELMRGDLFKGTGISYEDIIASAYETGLIKSEELDHILKFEEFWNPRGPSRFRTYANFAMSIAGTATVYLPPPWNLIGAVALMVTQSATMQRTKPDPDDNWNVII